MTRISAPLEHDEQSALIDWAILQSGKWPELKLLYHIPNEGKRSPAAARRLKQEGMKRGVPDNCLPVPRGKYHGLYIELKRIKGGKPTLEQKQWIEELTNQGYLALMASEGGRREKALMRNGCNYFGATTIRSAPFAIFSRQDLLQLALDLNVPVPEIYGQIVRDADGLLQTTSAQRTGCSMCGFGIHLEKRPHRFDQLYERNPKEWEFWMYEMGWGHVLDYIGVGWQPQIRMELDV